MAAFPGKWHCGAGLCAAALVAALAIAALPALAAPAITIETGPNLTLTRLQGTAVPARDVAHALVGKSGIRIEGIDRLGDARVTVNFTSVVSVDNVVAILAEVAGQEMRRLGPGTYRIGLPQNHAAIRKLEAEAEQARKAGNTAALERTLSRILELSAPTSPGTLDAIPRDAVEELDTLLTKRDDRAGAERVQRAWLAIVERNGIVEDKGPALIRLGRLRLTQGDPVGARDFYGQALKLAPSLGKGEASLATRARLGLAAVAIAEKRFDDANALQAQAEGGLKEAAEDSVGAVFRFHQNEGDLIGAAYDAKRKDRLETHFARRAAVAEAFPDAFPASMLLLDLDALARAQADLGKYDAARETSLRIVTSCGAKAEPGHEACPAALHRIAVLDTVAERYELALFAWKSVCALRVAVFGNQHRATQAAYADLRTLERLAAPGVAPSAQPSCPSAGQPPVDRSPRFDSALEHDLGIAAEILLEERIERAKANADVREAARLREQLARLQAARRAR